MGSLEECGFPRLPRDFIDWLRRTGKRIRRNRVIEDTADAFIEYKREKQLEGSL